MKLLGILLCGISAVLTLSLGLSLIFGAAGPEPFDTILRPVFAWVPCLLLVFLAAVISAQPRFSLSMSGRALAVLMLAGAFLWPAYALAQAAPASPTEVNLGGVFGDLRGTIETLVAVVVAAILGLIGALVKKNVGLSIDGKMRDTLQSAVMNGVHLGLDAVQSAADRTTIDVKSAVVADGIGYVRRYAPAAVKHFKLGDDDLAAMLKAKLAALQPAEAAAVAKVPGA